VSKWAVLVGTVDYAICAGTPGGRVTAANVGFPSSVVLFFVGLVVSGTQFVHCGAGPNDDCTTLMGCAALSVASLCAALWLNFREMPRLSEAWCAQAAARLRAEIPELQAAAPQLELEIAALSLTVWRWIPLQAVRLLLSRGADPEQKTVNETSAIDTAEELVRTRHCEVVLFLESS
jgi:hypothetical protein